MMRPEEAGADTASLRLNYTTNSMSPRPSPPPSPSPLPSPLSIIPHRESLCGVNSVMTAGVLDLCGVDTVMSGIDKFVCSVSTVMTAGESDVCGGDSVVSDEAGESSAVGVFVCGEGPLLVCVSDWLSVVADEPL